MSFRVSNQREAPKKWINNPDLILRKSDSTSECLLGWYIPDYNKMESNRELPQENSERDRCDPNLESKKHHSGRSTRSYTSRPPSNREISILKNGSNRMMLSSRVASNNAFYRDRELLENGGASLSSSTSPIPRCTSGHISVMDIVRSRSGLSSSNLNRQQSSRIQDSAGLLGESAPHNMAPGAPLNYSPFGRSRKNLSDVNIPRDIGLDNVRPFNLNPNQSGKFANQSRKFANQSGKFESGEDALRQGSGTKCI